MEDLLPLARTTHAPVPFVLSTVAHKGPDAQADFVLLGVAVGGVSHYNPSSYFYEEWMVKGGGYVGGGRAAIR